MTMSMIEPEALRFVLGAAAGASSRPCHLPPPPPLMPPSTAFDPSEAGGGDGAAADLLLTSTSTSTLDDDDALPGLRPLDPDESSVDTADDEEGLSSSSSSPRGSASRPAPPRRRVSFAAPLVTAVKTRPRTRDEERGALFYAQWETDRFRQIYREEKRSLSLMNPDDALDPSYGTEPEQGHPRRRISRVVVHHNDALETFYDLGGPSSPPPSSEDAGGTMGGTDDVFFDSDSFWSGSITWY